MKKESSTSLKITLVKLNKKKLKEVDQQIKKPAKKQKQVGRIYSEANNLILNTQNSQNNSNRNLNVYNATGQVVAQSSTSSWRNHQKRSSQ